MSSVNKTSAAGHTPVSRAATTTDRARRRDAINMPITSLEDLQRVANALLRTVMADERSKRWTKVSACA